MDGRSPDRDRSLRCALHRHRVRERACCYWSCTYLDWNPRGRRTSRPPFVDRNAFQMPRVVNIDLRIAKKFRLYESWNFELFGEAFNLFNHPNATSVGTRIYSIGGSAAAPTLTFDPQFGVVQSSSSTLLGQRQIQIEPD